jgi:hypothetical protein
MLLKVPTDARVIAHNFDAMYLENARWADSGEHQQMR